jgi:hypothetical protein
MMTMTVGKRRVSHRLIYRTLPQTADQVAGLPQHVLKFEMELSGHSSTSTQATQDIENTPKLNDIMLPSDESNSRADPVTFQGGAPQSGSLPALNNGWDSSCQVGRQTYINLMLPDRSVCHLWIVDFLTSCYSAQWMCSSVSSIGAVLL